MDTMYPTTPPYSATQNPPPLTQQRRFCSAFFRPRVKTGVFYTPKDTKTKNHPIGWFQSVDKVYRLQQSERNEVSFHKNQASLYKGTAVEGFCESP